MFELLTGVHSALSIGDSTHQLALVGGNNQVWNRCVPVLPRTDPVCFDLLNCDGDVSMLRDVRSGLKKCGRCLFRCDFINRLQGFRRFAACGAAVCAVCKKDTR